MIKRDIHTALDILTDEGITVNQVDDDTYNWQIIDNEKECFVTNEQLIQTAQNNIHNAKYKIIINAQTNKPNDIAEMLEYIASRIKNRQLLYNHFIHLEKNNERIGDAAIYIQF